MRKMNQWVYDGFDLTYKNSGLILIHIIMKVKHI